PRTSSSAAGTPTCSQSQSSRRLRRATSGDGCVRTARRSTKSFAKRPKSWHAGRSTSPALGARSRFLGAGWLARSNATTSSLLDALARRRRSGWRKSAGRHRTMRWVTRKNAAVDRIACPWLVRRFIDADAEFLYVDPRDVGRVAKEKDATPFDV